MAKPSHNIGIIGSGAWGTALAMVAARAGRRPLLWAHEADVVADINLNHENRLYLPDVALLDAIKATGNLNDLAGSEFLLLAAPAQHVRGLLKKLAKASGVAPIVICAKGIEEKSTKLLGAVLAEELPGHLFAVLSGPSFAAEVARDLPTALTLATKDKILGARIVEMIGARHFRLYQTDDVAGAQIGGAIKNVLAVACGIVAGRGMGENARASIITRGLAEMTRLGVACGARAETLMGLSGLGDLVLTCSSRQSRNMSLGAALGEGQKLADILARRSSVAEGVTTAAAAAELAKKHKVEMPIVDAVDAVLNGKAGIEDTIEALLARPVRTE